MPPEHSLRRDLAHQIPQIETLLTLQSSPKRASPSCPHKARCFPMASRKGKEGTAFRWSLYWICFSLFLGDTAVFEDGDWLPNVLVINKALLTFLMFTLS